MGKSLVSCFLLTHDIVCEVEKRQDLQCVRAVLTCNRWGRFGRGAFLLDTLSGTHMASRAVHSCVSWVKWQAPCGLAFRLAGQLARRSAVPDVVRCWRRKRGEQRKAGKRRSPEHLLRGV